MLKPKIPFSLSNYDEYYAQHGFVPVRPDKVTETHRHYPRVAWALDVAKEIKPKTMLDLGCLDGFATLTLVDKIPGLSGIGVDLSEDGVMYGNDNAKNLGLDAKFYQQTVESYLDETDQTFDLVIMFELIEHVKDVQAVLKQISKVLNPGGTLLISTPDFEAPTFGKDDEENTCHIRLYTTADEDYDAVNKYGNTRTATSMKQELKEYEIIEMDVYSELINVRATHGR